MGVTLDKEENCHLVIEWHGCHVAWTENMRAFWKPLRRADAW